MVCIPRQSYAIPVAYRVRLGVALLVALSFRFWPLSTSTMKVRTPQNLSYEEIVLESAKSKHIDKKRLLIHMEKEFSQLLFYFSMAAGVLSVVQVYGKPWLLKAGFTLPDFAAIPILLVLAFFFSILFYIRCYHRQVLKHSIPD